MLGRVEQGLQRHAWLIACLALFISLGGGAYAVTAAKNSVTSKSIKNGAVTGGDVKDNTLTGADIDEAKLDTSALPQGPRGAQGAQGPQGPTGAPGTSLFNASTIPSGQTVRGAIGQDSHAGAGGEDADVIAALPLPTSPPLTAATVDVDGADEVGNRCTGSPSNPTAPAGVVCIYTLQSVNLNAPNGFTFGSGSQQVFGIDVNANAAGDYYFQGIWAYTAP